MSGLEVERQAKEKLRGIFIQSPLVYVDFQSHIRRVIGDQIAEEESKGNLPLRDFEPRIPTLVTSLQYSSETNRTFYQLMREYGQILLNGVVKQIAKENDYYPTAEEYQRALERAKHPKPLSKNVQVEDDGLLE